MKAFLFALLISINFVKAFANGVIVGDGHPTIITKQERLDSTGVDKELEDIVARVAAFDPAIAHLLNVGVKALSEKKIVLIKILNESHDHYAYIEDARIRIVKPRYSQYYSLNSQPTIYFYENYFQLNSQNAEDIEEITKVKVVIHEFMHMYLGSSELKVQRVTDLIYKISTGNFEDIDLQNLRLELKMVLEKIVLSPYEEEGYGCEIDVGLKKMSVTVKNGTSLSLTIPSQILVDNFLLLSNAAQNAFRKNSNLYYKKIRKSSSTDENDRCYDSRLQLISLDYTKITYRDFIQFLYNADFILPREVIPTTSQLKEISDSNIPISSYYFSINLTKLQSSKYDVVIKSSKESTVSIPALKEHSYVSISDFDNTADLIKIFDNAKSLSKTNQGSINEVHSRAFTVFTVPTDKIAILPTGKFYLKDIRAYLYGVSEYEEPAIKENSFLTISAKNITFNSSSIKTNLNISPVTPYKLEKISAPVTVEVIE